MASGFTVLLEGAFSARVLKTPVNEEFTLHDEMVNTYARYKRCEHCNYAAYQGVGSEEDDTIIEGVRSVNI